MAKTPYQAYSSANYTVPKTRQVVMLYDGIIRQLNQACEAMQAGQVETRYHKLVRATEIIAGLQMSLDFDKGADTARMLYDLYSSLESRIMELHRSGDPVACAALIQDIRQMRTLWHRIDTGAINQDGTVDATDRLDPVEKVNLSAQEPESPSFLSAAQEATQVALRA